jgi:hypothetical protein
LGRETGVQKTKESRNIMQLTAPGLFSWLKEERLAKINKKNKEAATAFR